MVVKARYEIGDLVFAKVRGYPPWPARIEDPAKAGKKLNRTKYHVFFFGTYETATVQIKDLYPYEKYKVKYGIPRNRRFFNEALKQIKDKPDIRGVPNVKNLRDDDDSENEEISVDSSDEELQSKDNLENIPDNDSADSVPLAKLFLARSINILNQNETDNACKDITLNTSLGSIILNNQAVPKLKKKVAEKLAEKELKKRAKLEQKKKSLIIKRQKERELENKLMKLHKKIKLCIKLHHQHIQTCISSLIKLEQLPVTSNVLKRQNCVFKTLKNCSQLSYTDVSSKAKSIYSHFYAMLVEDPNSNETDSSDEHSENERNKTTSEKHVTVMECDKKNVSQ